MLRVPSVCTMVFKKCNEIELGEVKGGCPKTISNRSIHPCMQCIQCNSMQVTSIPFDVVRFYFNVFTVSQSNANSVSFHFMSFQFNSIKYLHPTPAANWPSIPDLPGPPVTSHAFPHASWALPQAPAKESWSVHQTTSPIDLCNETANEHSCWTSVLDSVGPFRTRFVNVWVSPCHYTGKTQGSYGMPFDAFSDAMSYEIYAWMKACCLPPASFRWQQHSPYPHILR